MKRKRSCGCFSLPVIIMLGFLLIVLFNNSNDRAGDVTNNVSVSPESSNSTDVILPTQPERTSTSKTDPTPTPTQSITDSIYAYLVSELDGETIQLVELVDQSLVIHTNLDRGDLVLFYEDIGTIHGVVVSENPIIDRVILSDVTGQQIIMPYQEMINFYEHTITWDQFRDTWEIIIP